MSAQNLTDGHRATKRRPIKRMREVCGSRSSGLRRLRDALTSSAAGRDLLSGLDSLLIPSVRRGNAVVRSLTARSHQLQHKIEGFLKSDTHWFDHEVDAQWQWAALQRSTFLERGVLNSLAIPLGSNVLDMCCGDGFHADRFYSARAKHVLAIDNDLSALRYAGRYHARPNIEYRGCDITDGLPDGPFGNIIWDAAMLLFTTEQTVGILACAHSRLSAEGVLSGYTVVDPDESNQFSGARMHFTAANQLAELLKREFEAVSVVETSDPLRGNLYFFAADSPELLPFPVGVRRAR